MSAPRLAIRSIGLFERPIRFRAPFRFGAATMSEASQAFVRVEVDVEGHGRGVGGSAETMVPKWFDKRPERSADDTVDDLRRSLRTARELYLSDQRPRTAFAHGADRVGEQVRLCAADGMPALAALFGPAEIDKAILDALLRAVGLPFFEGMRRNVAGLDSRLTPDLDEGAIERFLAGRRTASAIAIRHTVGLTDAIEDGLAATLRRTGARYLKLKLGGDVAADIERLRAILRVLEPLGLDWRASLDANEQYPDPDALGRLLFALDADPALSELSARLLYVEQPFPRELTMATPLGAAGEGRTVVIDEADDSYDAFPKARALGYRGVSSKSCKGLYKAVLNAVRVAEWSAAEPFLLTGEDLTTQPGLAVQQDTALAAFLGLTHVERNGHHYVDGFDGAPEAMAFAAAHPGFYRVEDGSVRLAMDGGQLLTAPLDVIGFGSATHPDWDGLPPLRHPPRPQAEVAAKGGPRSTRNGGASFGAPLRGAPQDDGVDGGPQPRSGGLPRGHAMPNYMIAQLDAVPAVPCPCGLARRAFAEPGNALATVHLTDITEDARTHYHKAMTEIYVILEGSGAMELDGERVPVGPFTSIFIKPGCRHRAVGRMRILNIPIPAFDPADEHFD